MKRNKAEREKQEEMLKQEIEFKKKELASQTKAELVVAHAFHHPGSWTQAGQQQAPPSLREQLNDLTIGMGCERVMHAGPPGPVICWLAQEHGCDLIIMGTHGRSGLGHMLFGSTAEHVLRNARCPVLTVRANYAKQPRLEEPIVMPMPGSGA